MVTIKRNSITSQSFLMITFSGLTSIISLVGYSLAARNLPVQDVAKGILLTTIAWYATSLIDFGGSTYVVREIMGERISLEVGKYFGLIKIALLVPLLGLGLIFFHSQIGIVFRLFILIFLLLAINLMSIEFRTSGFTSALSVVSLIEKTTLLFWLIITIYVNINIYFIDLIIISNFFAFCFALMLGNKSHSGFRPAKIKRLFIGSLGIGSSSAVTQIQILDVNLLALKIGTLAASPYVLVTRWTNALGIFSNVFSQAIAPQVAKKNLTKTDILEVTKNTYLIFLSFIVCTLVAFQANNLVDFFLGEKFENSGNIVRILALATILSTIAQPLSIVLQSRQNPWKVTLALISGILCQFLYIFLFSAETGAIAAAYGFLLGQFITTILLIYFSRILLISYLKFLF